MWKSAKQALDPKALFSPDPHAQRVQAQMTPVVPGAERFDVMIQPCGGHEALPAPGCRQRRLFWASSDVLGSSLEARHGPCCCLCHMLAAK